MSNPNITQARQAAVVVKPSLAHIPGTGYWPIFSEASYFKDSLAFVQTIYQRCGPVSRAWWGFKRSVYLLSAEANEMVLLDREGRFSAKLGWERYIGDLFPRGLLLHDAEDHRWQRRLMLPAFRKDALAHYLERMNPRIQTAITAWGQSGQIHFYPLIKQLTLAIAADVFLGAQLDAEIEQISRDYTRLVIASMAIVRIPVLGYTYARGVKARARLAQFIRERIPQRRASEGSDLFTQLCQVRDEQGAHFSDDEIIDHLIFMMTAAHDTTTSATHSLTRPLAVARTCASGCISPRCKSKPCCCRCCASLNGVCPLTTRRAILTSLSPNRAMICRCNCAALADLPGPGRAEADQGGKKALPLFLSLPSEAKVLFCHPQTHQQPSARPVGRQKPHGLNQTIHHLIQGRHLHHIIPEAGHAFMVNHFIAKGNALHHFRMQRGEFEALRIGFGKISLATDYRRGAGQAIYAHALAVDRTKARQVVGVVSVELFLGQFGRGHGGGVIIKVNRLFCAWVVARD